MPKSMMMPKRWILPLTKLVPNLKYGGVVTCTGLPAYMAWAPQNAATNAGTRAYTGAGTS